MTTNDVQYSLDEFPDEWLSHSKLTALTLAVEIQKRLINLHVEAQILEKPFEADYSLHPTLNDFSVQFINKPWGCDVKIGVYEISVATYHFLGVWKDLVLEELVWGGRYTKQNLTDAKYASEIQSLFLWRKAKNLSQEEQRIFFTWCVFNEINDVLADLLNLSTGNLRNIISDIRTGNPELNIPHGNTKEKSKLDELWRTTLHQYANDDEKDWYKDFEKRLIAKQAIVKQKKG